MNDYFIVSLSTGCYHTASITHDSKVYVWGNNFWGQLLPKEDWFSGFIETPTQVNSFLLETEERIISVSAGMFYTLVLTNNGRVFAWGLNKFGQLGIGTTEFKQMPTQVIFDGLKNKEYIASLHLCSEGSHNFAVTNEGRVYGWGNNENGQLGDNTYKNRHKPILIEFDCLKTDEFIKRLSTSFNGTIATTNKGRVFGWGNETWAEPISGSLNSNGKPKLIFLDFLKNYEEIDWSIPCDLPSDRRELNYRTYRSAIFLTTMGRFITYQNKVCDLNNFKDKIESFYPKIKFISLTPLKKGEKIDYINENYLITSSGMVYAWGHNHHGELGDGTKLQVKNPKRVYFKNLQLDEKIKYVSSGADYSIALTTKGRIFLWGENSYGKIGSFQNGNTKPTLITNFEALK